MANNELALSLESVNFAYLPISLVSFNPLSTSLLEQRVERDNQVRQVGVQTEITVGVHCCRERVERSQPLVRLLVPCKGGIMLSEIGVMRKAT